MVIGLELFEHPSQFMLDQWTKGLIFKDDFKKELQADPQSGHPGSLFPPCSPGPEKEASPSWP